MQYSKKQVNILAREKDLSWVTYFHENSNHFFVKNVDGKCDAIWSIFQNTLPKIYNSLCFEVNEFSMSNGYCLSPQYNKQTVLCNDKTEKHWI